MALATAGTAYPPTHALISHTIWVCFFIEYATHIYIINADFGSSFCFCFHMSFKMPNKSLNIPFWSLLLSNIAIIVWAMLAGWVPAELILVYWFQTLALSIFSCLRLLRFRFFLIEEIKSVKFHSFTKPEIDSKTLLTTPDSSERNRQFWPPLLGLCFFHAIYYAFLVGEMNVSPNSAMLWAGIIFFINQFFTFLYQRKKDLRSKVFVKKYEAYNMFRIIPIHFTLFAAAILRDVGVSFESRFVLLIFLFFKTAIDTGMYVYEGKVFQQE